MNEIKLKLLAIKNIITNEKFYLATFDDKNKIKSRTDYGVNGDDFGIVFFKHNENQTK